MTRIFDTLRGLGFRRGPRRILAGIGGGLSAKLGLNVWLVRALLLASFLLPVLGFGAYLVAWILLPWQDGSIPAERVLGGRPVAAVAMSQLRPRHSPAGHAPSL